MSVRIFPPSDEKREDFEFDFDKFMGKWLVVVPFVTPGFLLIFWQVRHPLDPTAVEGKYIGVFPDETGGLHFLRTKKMCQSPTRPFLMSIPHKGS